MSIVLVVAAFVTVVGALVAVTTRDARWAIGSLVVALVAAPFVTDPLPDPGVLGVRVVAALLGGYVLYVLGGRAARPTRGSLVGLPAEALAAAAAFVIGVGSSGLASEPAGPPLALGAGLALVALAAAPVARAGDALRLGIGLTILMTGAELVRVGFAGTPAPLEELLTAGLTVALLAVAAVLASAALSATDGFSLREESRTPPVFEAHPIAAPVAERRAGRSWRPTRGGRPGSATGSDRPSGSDRAAGDEASPGAGSAADGEVEAAPDIAPATGAEAQAVAETETETGPAVGPDAP